MRLAPHLRAAIRQTPRVQTYQASCLHTGAANLDQVKQGGKVTHTGQKFDANDWKVGRFVDREKLVNTNVAQTMVAEMPVIKTKKRIIWCNGGGGALGHPKVFINLDKPGVHYCPYCGQGFMMIHGEDEEEEQDLSACEMK